jgi:XTP/dITP diphosphohydrolase
LKLVIATRNADKVREIAHLLGSLPVRLLSLEQFPGAPAVREDGSTFEENAIKKARSACAYTGETSLGEDSGLAVDHLAGAPGVLSARFAGEAATYRENNEKLLSLLEGVPLQMRTAVFVSVAALSFPEGEVQTFTGRCRGVISDSPRGTSGFGYDPLFLIAEHGKTFAELGEEMKNRISHRAQAMTGVKEYLKKRLSR